MTISHFNYKTCSPRVALISMGVIGTRMAISGVAPWTILSGNLQDQHMALQRHIFRNLGPQFKGPSVMGQLIQGQEKFQTQIFPENQSSREQIIPVRSPNTNYSFQSKDMERNPYQNHPCPLAMKLRHEYGYSNT